MSDVAVNVVLRSIPGLMPFTGVALGFIGLGLVSLIVYLSVIAALSEFRDSVKEDNQSVLLIYAPAVASILGGLGSLIDQAANVIQSLAALAASSLITIAFLIIAAAVAFLFLNYESPFFEGVAEVYTCTIYPDAVAPILSVLNTIDFFIASVLPIGNFVNIQIWSQIGIIRRVLIDCSISGGWESVTDFLSAFANGVAATAQCITTFLSGGDLLTARIDFVPGLTVFLGSFEKLAFVYDCACNYLSFFWDGLFGLPALPSLTTSLDCAGNFWLRWIQAFAVAVSNRTLPDVGPPTEEFQCAEIAFGLWLEDVVAFFGTTVIDFLFLIPATVSSSVYDAQLLLPARVTQSRSGGLYASVDGIDPRILMAEILANSDPHWIGIAAINFSAPWNWTAIAAYFVNILETPWTQPITYTIAGIAAFANGTVSVITGLSPLALNNSALSFADIQYFQVGYIMDWFRGAAVGFGAIVAAITTSPEMGPAVWGLIWFPIGWVQIVIELARDFFFMNYFYPAATGNPFQAWTLYCNSNTSQWAANYALLYNNSAYVGQVFGCNASLSVYPLQSPFANCSDSPLGGVVFNSYRLIGEAFQYPVTLVCNLPMLLTFKPPLFYSPPSPQIFANPSNPPLLNWANMTLDPLARQWLNVGGAINNLFYFFDQNAVLGGYPQGVPCQYPDSSSPTGIGYRVSILCTVGNLFNVLIQLVGSAVYPIITGINMWLGSVAVPALSSQVLLPTFGDSIRNLQVLGCLIGALIGSVFPTTFSCSAQATSSGNIVFGIQQVPPPQLSNHLPIAALAKRTNTVDGLGTEVPRFCFYPRSAWADTTVICNCSNYNASLYTPNGTTPAPCVVQCLSPTVIFPYIVGFNNTDRSTFNCTVNGSHIPLVTTTFTNFSTLQAFLGATFSVPASPTPSGISYLPYPAVDPTNLTLPAYLPKTFMQELVTAQLNDAYNAMYQPNFNLIPSPTAAASCYTFGASAAEVAFATSVIPAAVVYGINMRDMLQLITYVYYGQADVAPTLTNLEQVVMCNIPVDWGFRPVQVFPMYNFANGAFFFWLATYGFAETARILMQYLTVYNSAFTGCSEYVPAPATSLCFSAGRIPTASAPPIVPANTPTPGDPNSICAFPTPDWFVTTDNMTNCNCSQPSGYYYSAGNAACLIFCEPPFPLTVGARADLCLTPAACGNAAAEIANVSVSNAYISFLFTPITAPLGQNDPPSGIDGGPGYFVTQVYTALLNLYYLQKHRPGLFVYVRPVYDQLLSKPCLGLSDLPYRVFEGVEMATVIHVISELWLGNRNAPRNCYTLFRHSSPAFQLCGLILSQFTPWIDPGVFGAFSSNTTSFILPVLESFNGWARTCTLNASCFVTTTFDLANKTLSPAGAPLSVLSFTNQEYYTLRTTPVAELTPCPDLIPCFTRSTCSASRVITEFLSVISNVITQLNDQNTFGGGNWTLGQNVWQILNTVLTQELGPVLSAVLDALSLLDCTICGIEGNNIFNQNNQRTWPCAAVLFSFAQPVAALFDEVGGALIGLIVDTSEFVVNQIYYLMSFQVVQFILSIINYIGEVFQDFLIPFFEGLFAWIFGEFCGCTIWNFFATFQCTNAPSCNNRRRDLLSLFETTVDYVVRYMFQSFAPDWPNPARYYWAASDACAAPMALYAQHATNLTEDEANEVAFCLARIILFANITTHYIHLEATSVPQFDECTYVMQHYAPTQSFNALAPHQRAQALSCIQARGNIYGLKRGSSGMLDWVPDWALTHVANPFATWLPLIQTYADAQRVHTERNNDLTFTDAVLASPEYAASLEGAYGTERVALLGLARANLIAPIDDYTVAVLGGSASQKRGLPAASSPYMARVTSMAEMLGVLQTGFRTRYLPRVYATWRDNRTATAPPLYETKPLPWGGARVETATTANMIKETFSASGPIATERRMYTVRARTVRIFKTLARGSAFFTPPEETLTLGGSTSDAILNVRQQIPRYTDEEVFMRRRSLDGAGARANMQRPNILYVLYRGVRASFTAARDMWSGRAVANATIANNDLAAAASFDWHLTQLPSVPMPENGWYASGKRVMGDLFGPTLSGPMARYQIVWRSLWQLAALDRRAIERSRRIDVTQQAMKNTLAVVLWNAPLGRVPRHPVAMSQKRQFGPSNATVPTDFCFNITTIEFCQQCFYLNQYFGYTALGGRQDTWWYNTTSAEAGPFSVSNASDISLPPWGPNPAPQNSQAYANATYFFINNYLANITATPLFVGKSAALPARFPNVNHPLWDYLDDTVANKTRFTAWEPLFNATWVFLQDLLRNFDLLAPSQFTFASTTTTVEPTVKRMSRRHVVTTLKRALLPKVAVRYLPRAMSETGAEFNLDRLVVRSLMQAFKYQPKTRSPTEPVVIGGRIVAQAEFHVAVYDTLQEILEGWAQLIWEEFIYCRYDSELDATNVRYSLIQAAALGAVPAIILGLAIASLPTLLVPFVVLSAPVWATIGVWVSIGTWIGLATGWKILCFPTLPTILFGTMGTQALATSLVLNKCPMWFSGLVREASYDNSNCMVCENWSNGTFTIFSCKDDLGWGSPFDVPVFWLKACQGTSYFCSGWLATVQNPANFNAFIASLLSTPLIQEWLHRWDDIDLTDPIGYSSQYQCAFWLIGIWLVLSILLGQLFSIGPAWQTIKFFLALFSVLIQVAILFLFGFFVVVYAAFDAPMELIKRATARKRGVSIDSLDME